MLYVKQNEDGSLSTCSIQLEGFVFVNSLPKNRQFRNAWRFKNGTITINLSAAKEGVHVERRKKRSTAFKPWDDAVMLQLPNVSLEDAEAARKVIRDQDALLQVKIDLANEEKLREIAKELGA